MTLLTVLQPTVTQLLCLEVKCEGPHLALASVLHGERDACAAPGQSLLALLCLPEQFYAQSDAVQPIYVWRMSNGLLSCNLSEPEAGKQGNGHKVLSCCNNVAWPDELSH